MLASFALQELVLFTWGLVLLLIILGNGAKAEKL